MSDNILDEAKAITTGARQDVYGHPYEDFTRIAKMWAAILGKEITPEQVGLCMIAVKMGRLCHTPGHRDSIVDIAGYANTLDMIRERKSHFRVSQHSGRVTET